MKLTINPLLSKAIKKEVALLEIKYPSESSEILYDRAAKHLARTRPELFSPFNMMEGIYLTMFRMKKMKFRKAETY